MSSLKQQAAQALATYLAAQIPGTPFSAVSADYEKDIVYPSAVVIPRRGQFMPWQDDEMDTTVDKQLVTVGEFEGTVEIRLCGLEQPDRENLEQQIVDVLSASEFSPGVVTLQAPPVKVGSVQFLHQPLVVFSLTEEDWQEEMVFTSERYASLTLDAWYHAFAARDYPNLEQLQLCLTQDVLSDPTTVVFEEVVVAPMFLTAFSASGALGYTLRPAASAVGATPSARVWIVEADSNQQQTSDGTHWYDPMGNVLT